MLEVEKMYENANLTNLYCGDDYIAEYMLELECTNGNKEKCRTCDKVKTGHPPFTAEKQLELIKWLINEVDYITMWHFNNSKKPYDFDLGSRNSGGETFEDALAQMINNLWQDLTEEERKQIKEILE